MKYCYVLKTLAVEYSHVKEGKDAVKQFMEDKGYSVVGEVPPVPDIEYFTYDMIFVKKS
jgi:hypothetical protein